MLVYRVFPASFQLGFSSNSVFFGFCFILLYITGMKQNKQLQPNQCAAILTCVVSCKHGYKLGSKGLDGCPTCQCLE
jgi:hypothetical protein